MPDEFDRAVAGGSDEFDREVVGKKKGEPDIRQVITDLTSPAPAAAFAPRFANLPSYQRGAGQLAGIAAGAIPLPGLGGSGIIGSVLSGARAGATTGLVEGLVSGESADALKRGAEYAAWGGGVGGLAGIASPVIRRVLTRFRAAQPATPEAVSIDNIVDLRTPIERVKQALKNAPTLTKRQESLNAAERLQRMKKASAVGRRTTGESGLYAELGQLKGEFKKVDFESIRSQLDQTDIDALLNQIKISPKLQWYDTISARTAFVDLLQGKLPPPSQLALLEKSLGEDFVQTIMEKRPTLSKLAEAGHQLVNLPRALKSSFDLSAPLRQGLWFLSRPKQFGTAFVKMLQSAPSEKVFNQIADEIHSRPTSYLMNRSKLALTDVGRFPSLHEEAYIAANWAEKIPVIGKGVKASNRAYTTFLNRLRADVFDDMIRQTEMLGSDPLHNPRLTSQIADYINAATGRAKLPGSLEKSAVVLNDLLFSPRLVYSRVKLLNPATYLDPHIDPFVRKQAWRDLFAMSAFTASMLKLGNMAGMDVTLDRQSPDFLKLKVGNTRYDIMGGFQQFLRFGLDMIQGPADGSRLDRVEKFARSKASPVAGFAYDMLRGTDMQGEPTPNAKQAADLVSPLMLKDAWDAYQEWGAAGAAMSVPGVFGVGVQTYE